MIDQEEDDVCFIYEEDVENGEFVYTQELRGRYFIRLSFRFLASTHDILLLPMQHLVLILAFGSIFQF